MPKTRLLTALFCLLCLLSASACDDSDSAQTVEKEKYTGVSTDFESGAIGRVVRNAPQNWDIYLAADNGNADLPDSYRNWWYIKVEDFNPGTEVKLTLKNRGWAYYYAPVFSYDKITWHRFDETEVTASDACDEGIEDCFLEIATDRFVQSPVYVARFYPYTTWDMYAYLDQIEASPWTTITTLGRTSGYGADIPFIKIEDPSVDDSLKRAVWIHARSHPAETASSYMLEGMINQFLADLDAGLDAAKHLVFFVAPMHNIDGVIKGNYRTDLFSRNFEVMWYRDDADPLYLTEDSPVECRLLNQKMAELAQNADYLTGMVGFNLHSSNSPVDTPAFAYPHFGDDPATYTAKEISLWKKSLYLIHLITQEYGFFSAPPAEGGSSFVTKYYPESWWWANMGDDCLAITIETVYSKGGMDHWLTQDDIRDLGVATTLALYDYAADPSAWGKKAISAGGGLPRLGVPNEDVSKE
ncbi:M14-type cytosolic carboxypeptidase [Desulfatibacillum aliphaticivorans]|uniref:M14-type cytosolic carboxypeptidase n=1 Tax=Desulfatibacillum aliphaticivorans TaxID=218208 RepID=UPI0004136EF3|nr:M14-type cytosolic carboxypeptidase [Desulfatibacillum aliphaticivorans]